MSIRRGTQAMTRVFRGTREVVKICRGTRAVYEKETEKTLVSISITTLPTKRIYTVGETLDLSGLVVAGTFSDSSTENVTAGCTVEDSQHVFTAQDLQEGLVHSHHVVTFYVTHPLADGGNAVDFFEVGVRAADDTDSLLLLHLSSEPTQSLYFTQSVPNGVRINWGDGSASESSADTSATISHAYDSSQWSDHKAYLVHFSADSGVAWQPGMSVTSGSTTTNYGVIGVYNSKSATYPTLVGFHFGSDCSLRAYSFANCTGLAKIEIPDGTSIVPEYAFVGCKLRSVAIPASVASVEAGGLWGAISSYDCNVYITDLSAYCSISYTLSANEVISAAFAVPCIYLVLNGQTLSGTLKIPDGVTNIGFGALSRLHGITSIHIPSSVTTIDDYAFVGCDNLAEFTLPSTVQTAGDCLFRGGGYSNMQNIEIAAANVGAEILPATESELKVWIRSTTAKLGVNLPYNSNVTIYCEPSSKPSGWGSAFNKIYSSGNAVTTIWGQTTSPFSTRLDFTLTSNLTLTINFAQSAEHGVTIDWGDGSTPETFPGTAHTSSGVTTYWVAASHTWGQAGDYTVTMTAGRGVTWKIGTGDNLLSSNFLGKAGSKSSTSPEVTGIRFGDGCTAIGANAFDSCTSLTSLNIPDSITAIGKGAMRRCTSLVSANIPSSVSELGGKEILDIDSMFSDDTGLKYVEIACPIVYSEEDFTGCSALEKVWIRSSVEEIKNHTYTNGNNETYTYGICTGANPSAVLYCEDASAQTGWESYWDKRDVSTETTGFAAFAKVWGQTTRPW